MAMSARVTNTVHGMVAEKRGGSRRLHRHDPLGSVIGLINDSATTTDTYTYWPYGTLQASTGSTQQPWKFVGKYGYYTDSATHTYVRARKYRKDLGRWLTVDPLWPEERAYGYAWGNPQSHADMFGLGVQFKNCKGNEEKAFREQFCKDLGNAMRNNVFKDKLLDCITRRLGDKTFRDWVEKILRRLIEQCNGKGPTICIVCNPQEVSDRCLDACSGQNKERFGLTIYPLEGRDSILVDPKGKPVTLGDPVCRGDRNRIDPALGVLYGSPEDRCGKGLLSALKGAGADCSALVILCPKGKGQTAFHELVHAIGVGGQTGHGKKGGGVGDLVERIEECVAALHNR